MRIGGAPKQGDNIALLVLQSMLAFSGIRYKAVDRRDSQEATFAMQAKKHAHTHTRGSHGGMSTHTHKHTHTHGETVQKDRGTDALKRACVPKCAFYKIPIMLLFSCVL